MNSWNQLPSPPVVSVATNSNVTVGNPDVVEMALVKTTNVSRVDFGWTAIARRRTIEDARDGLVAISRVSPQLYFVVLNMGTLRDRCRLNSRMAFEQLG